MAAVLLACGAVAALPQGPVEQSDVELDQLVEGERKSLGLPGLAVVVVRSDAAPRISVSGERRLGTGDRIAPADRMHLGSLTKAITATLIGAMAEKQLMTPESTIGQVFPERSAGMQPAYRSVTVRQLLTHAAGITPYRTRESMLWMLALTGPASEQREVLLDRVLAQPPRFEPGSRREYSNAGGAIAGAMAERIGGRPYHELVQELVFGPLGGRAAFGNPGSAREPQPWGHVRTLLGLVTAVAPADTIYTTPLAIEPAGDASPALPDYARFLQLHLRGMRGRDDVLKAATIQDLHRPVPPAGVPGAAMGWTIMPRDGGVTHEHVGSYGAYVAYAAIQPSRDVAVAAFTNMGGDQDLRNALARFALRIAGRFPIAD